MSLKKDLNGLIRQYKRRGWSCHHTGRTHICLSKGDHKIFTSSTPSYQSSLKNFVALIKRKEREIGSGYAS
jgi:hypothetical protein